MLTDRAHRDVRRAWLSLRLYPLSFFAAFGIGEGLATLLGLPTGSTEPAPVWLVLLATVPALAVFVLPGLLSGWYARQAARAGDRGGVPAAIVGAALGLGFVALNVAAYVVGLLAD